MSNAAIDWAISRPCTGNQKLILIILANHADTHADKRIKGQAKHDQIVWIGMDELIKRSGAARSTVFEAIKANETAGYIRNHGKQPPYAQKSYVWELVMTPAATQIEERPRVVKTWNDGISATRPSRPSQTPPSASPPEHIRRPRDWNNADTTPERRHHEQRRLSQS